MTAPLQSTHEIRAYILKTGNFSEIEQLELFHAPNLNMLFKAGDTAGHSYFIKACHLPDIVKSEYRHCSELYKISPNHFVRPVSCHIGKIISFTCFEFCDAPTLPKAIQAGLITGEQKLRCIEDIYSIFLALKQSDTVHRDLPPHNYIWHNGHLKLIDFQTAVSKSDYRESPLFPDIASIVRWDRKEYCYAPFAWDDSYSLLTLLKIIGCPPHHKNRFQEIAKEIEAHIGIDTIHFRIPGIWSLRWLYLQSYIRVLINFKARKRNKHKQLLAVYRDMIQAHHQRKTTQQPSTPIPPN